MMRPHSLRLMLTAVLLAAAAPTYAQIGTPNVWNVTALPGAHNVTDLVVDPLFPDTVYVTTVPGTVFRSLDQTATWTEVGAAIGTNVSSLALTPTNTAIIYAGTGGNGVYKSTDRAATWAATTLTGLSVQAMDVDPGNAAVVYAATSDSLMKSTDSGATWARVGPDSLTLTDVVMSPARPDTLFVGTNGDGVYRSQDAEQTFARVNTGLTNLQVQALAPHPTRTDTLYAATNGGVYRSYDRGASWTAANNGLTTTSISAIAVSRSAPSVLYAGAQNGKVFKSADGGTTWFDITLALPDAATVGGLAVQRDSSNVVYAGILNVHRLRKTGLDSVSTLPTGASPGAMATGDLDGNDEPDMLVANTGGNTVSVYLTDVALASLARTDVLTGSRPADVALGDFDGDDDLDMAAANRVKQTVSVAVGNGSGGFGAPGDLFIGKPVTDVVLGDFDTDGDLDLAAGVSADGAVRVFLNDGVGSFGAPLSFSTVPDLEGFARGDFTGDGLLDLIALSRSNVTLTVYTNGGSASFTPTDTTTVSATPIEMAIADFDIDGNLDVAVATTDDRILVYGGEGDGSFGSPSAISLPDTLTGLAAADMDQDGYPDLVTAEPGGTVRARINDGGGGFSLSPTTVGSVSGPGAVQVADFSGDDAPDVAVARPGSGSVALLLSGIAQNIKDPDPPRDFTASDTQGDLGDNVTLSWRRPRVDETTGRITLYRVYRADDETGPYSQIALLDTTASHTIDSVFVNRTFVNSNATLGDDFFYYAISENAGGTQSARSDTVSASSAAQAFFDFEFDGSSPFHVRDTIDVTVRLNLANQDIQSFSLFVDYDRRALTALDADASEAGLQPFVVDSLLALQAQVLENSHDTTTSTGMIDYGLGFLPETTAEAVNVGSLRFVSLRDTTTRLRIASSASTNRETATTLRDDGSTVTPFIAPATTLVLRNHRVWGSVAFQGDVEDLALDVRFDLTQNTVAGTPLPDSVAYEPPNDLDLNANGVQTRLNSDGSFVLQQVPTGTYGLFVKAFHFLRGRVATDSLVVNDTLGVASDVTFEWISPDSSINTTSLRAGDANNDNRVNLTDFGILAAHFGTSGFAPGSPSWGADFNHDGVVDLGDFALLQSNFGEVGFGTSVPAKEALSPARLALAADPQQDGATSVALMDADGVVGFSVDVTVSGNATLNRSVVERSDWLRSTGDPMLLVRDLSTPSQRSGQGLRIAVAFRGTSRGLSGSGSVLRLAADPDAIDLANAVVLYEDGALAPASGVRHIPPDLVSKFPVHPQLYQNHPNPFNPETVIPFDVSEPSPVTLRIYSPLGQEIRSLLQASAYSPGRHQIRWDGRDNDGREVASGVYLYQISIGSFADVRKAVLLR